METVETQKSLAALEQRVEDFERYVKERFQETDVRMNELATKNDIAALHQLLIDPRTGESKLADKEDVARLNNIVYNFTLGVQILSTGGKWIYYGVIGFAALMGAIGIITGGFKTAILALIHLVFSNSQ